MLNQTEDICSHLGLKICLLPPNGGLRFGLLHASSTAVAGEFVLSFLMSLASSGHTDSKREKHGKSPKVEHVEEAARCLNFLSLNCYQPIAKRRE
jgi:hypothetical protein